MGCIDDDPKRLNRTIHGIGILGNQNKIPELVTTHDIEKIFIAIPSANGDQIRSIADTCEKSKV